MKRLIYQVYVGPRVTLYDFCTSSVAEYCRQIGVDHKIQKVPLLYIKPDPFMTGRSKEAVSKLGYLPIFEKENAFSWFNEYDQILILDSDVYVKPDAPNIFDQLEPGIDFAGVVEREMPITDAYVKKIVNYSQMQYGPLSEVDFAYDKKLGHEFYNMGVMLMNKSIKRHMYGLGPREFLKRPEFKRFVDGQGTWKWSTDQTLLNYWLRKENVPQKHLDWRWNALYSGVKDECLNDAYFIHFFLKDKLKNKGDDVEQLVASFG
jgi:hypothetical protein